MSVKYTSIGWNPHKKRYDAVMVGAMALYLGTFVGVGKLAPGTRNMSDEVLILRALGTLGILMLHVVLCIGPLARLDPRFAPLLYNRRHLGVATFLVGLVHAIVSLGYYHGFGAHNPLVSLLVTNTRFDSFSMFPFEWLGVVALAILFLMAATSHDFWLKNLSPSAWKHLHMLVYFAYGALVLHVALGALQLEKSPVYSGALLLGVIVVGSLHLLAGRREFARDRARVNADPDDARWLDICDVSETRESRARVVCANGHERIAIFRHNNTLSAVSNLCAHQGGPLGEGRIVDGCITCPWHGYQYFAHNGQSPPPFTEKIKTYQVRIVGSRVQLDPTGFPEGTPVQPAPIPQVHVFAHNGGPVPRGTHP